MAKDVWHGASESENEKISQYSFMYPSYKIVQYSSSNTAKFDAKWLRISEFHK